MKTLAFLFLLILPASSMAGEPAAPPAAEPPQGPQTITINGRDYEQATFKKLDAMTVRITHQSGVARVPITALPEAIQQRLGYDPAAASELAALRKLQAYMAQQKAERAARIARSPIIRITVTSVLGTGLIGSARIYSPQGTYESEQDIYLHTPTAGRGFVDGSLYQFNAERHRSYQFTTVLGATRTVPQFIDLEPAP